MSVSAPAAEAVRPAPEPEGPGSPVRTPRAQPGQRHPDRLAAVVLVTGLIASLVLSLLTRSVIDRSQRSLLLNQANVSGAAVAATLGQLQSSLDAVATVAATAELKSRVVERAGTLPAMSLYSSLVVLSQQGQSWVPTVTVRPASIPLDGGTSAVATALQAVPPAGLEVLGFVGSGATRALALADRPPGIPTYLIYVELADDGLAPPLKGLDFALYLGDTESAGNLILASTPHLPLAGTRAVVRIGSGAIDRAGAQLSSRPGDTTGQPNDLLMIFTPSAPLGGTLGPSLPWIVLVVGILLACLAAAGSLVLLSARNRALELVQGQRLTNASRDRALAAQAESDRERGRLEAQLSQAQRLEAVGQLAGGVAHDFNNLLAVIINFGHFALKALPGHPAESDVEQMVHAAQRGADLTRQLLIFSRQEVVRPESVDLNRVIEDTCRLLGRTLGEQVHLELRLDPALPRVEADINGVEQLMMNLAVNARDAMPEGGRLSITTTSTDLDASYSDAHLGAMPGPHALLEVSDTGVGMTPEVSLQIFEPFFTTKPAGVGTGMGLATVYGIVKRWGGHISVYSEVGVGTAFKVWLPIASSPELTKAPAAPVQVASRAGAGRRVLLVEDEPAVRRAARRILESSGYAVAEAGDGPQALAAFQDAAPDVVVTDVIMPGGLSGKALVEKLRQRDPGVAALFMSGYTADIITARGFLEADFVLVQKPFSAEELLAGVQRAVAAHHPASGR